MAFLSNSGVVVQLVQAPIFCPEGWSLQYMSCLFFHTSLHQGCVAHLKSLVKTESSTSSQDVQISSNQRTQVSDALRLQATSSSLLSIFYTSTHLSHGSGSMWPLFQRKLIYKSRAKPPPASHVCCVFLFGSPTRSAESSDLLGRSGPSLGTPTSDWLKCHVSAHDDNDTWGKACCEVMRKHFAKQRERERDWPP